MNSHFLVIFHQLRSMKAGVAQESSQPAFVSAFISFDGLGCLCFSAFLLYVVGIKKPEMELVVFLRVSPFTSGSSGFGTSAQRKTLLVVTVREKALSHNVIPDPATDTLEKPRKDCNSSMS